MPRGGEGARLVCMGESKKQRKKRHCVEKTKTRAQLILLWGSQRERARAAHTSSARHRACKATI